METKPTLASVLDLAKTMCDAHQLTPVWVREKLTARIDSLTEEDVEKLEEELKTKLAEHQKKQPARKKATSKSDSAKPTSQEKSK